MNEFKMDAPEQEPDWSVRMREVHSDQLKRVRAEARALIEQMRGALILADDEKGGSINSRMAVVDALAAADEWMKVNP